MASEPLVRRRTGRWALGVGALLASGIAAAQSTDFIQWDRNYRSRGDWTAQQFTVTASRATFRLRAATDYRADTFVFAPSELRRFQRNQSVRAWGMDNEFGTMTLTLPRGTYYLGTRNQVSGRNRIRVEFDFLLNVPGSRFVGWGIADAGYVPVDGGWWYHTFRVERGIRNFMDGCTTGIETYIIPSSDVWSFTRGDRFRYYAQYSGTATSLPGLYELRLPVGGYAIAFWNSDYWDEGPVTYDIERWSGGSSRAPMGLSTAAGGALSVGSAFSSAGVDEVRPVRDVSEMLFGRQASATGLVWHPGRNAVNRGGFSSFAPALPQGTPRTALNAPAVARQIAGN